MLFKTHWENMHPVCHHEYSLETFYSSPDAQVDVKKIRYESSVRKLKMELAKDQQCLKDDLEVELTNSLGEKTTYPVSNGEYAEIEGDVQCSPCNAIVRVKSDSIWNSTNPKETELWFGKSEFIPTICDHI
ncbi:hypothetical protein D915_008217 [Fasciola hepatica]|uniref:Uncharacterized protein n=1 Tax=Fasciola hepatica TaxID=6192 RepID=A0A4E0R3S6_FASHE|nr:hypothetical protein D915_008217 [Fasciola hepatica]